MLRSQKIRGKLVIPRLLEARENKSEELVQKPSRAESHQSQSNKGWSKTCQSTHPIESVTAAGRGCAMMIYGNVIFPKQTAGTEDQAAQPARHLPSLFIQLIDTGFFLPPYAGGTSHLLILLFLPAVPASYLPKSIQTLAMSIFSWAVWLRLKPA